MTRVLLAAALGCCSGMGCAEPHHLEPMHELDAGVDASEISCATDEGVIARVFSATCTSRGCHGSVGARARLDLESPGLSERIRGAQSVHMACRERLLVVPGNPPASFMIDKILGEADGCGDPMPLRGRLSAAERRCVSEWIAAMPAE